ncbi:GNAT family N-acetyltransferase [Streptomyces radicis]|uniref:GNAT family N-acetyltransferase n=1 Tax=Streptomyces radicis TaxID=1750517 RepID=A0A3A9VTP3_9ACTN|nr:GNAT family N-acetyltransferase [Streptomyces radicis]RKN04100.1 GNAT family N-acetyltransferase [Streptomyces radicis]RKN14419.1 GNAT family N-acetyltransferase [Streptomyces radicis]
MTSELVIRALVEDEAREVFTSLSDPGLVGRPLADPPFNAYETRAAGGEYRPDWTFVAERDGTVVARAAFWAGPDDDEPVALDWFDFTDPAAGVALLREAPLRADYELLLPPGWRDSPAVREAARARVEAATEAGWTPLVERHRYLWTPRCGLPERTGRLVLRPEPDDEVVLDVLRRVHGDTLDQHARRAVEQGGVDLAAREEMDFFRWCPSPREWLRLAYTPGGELVGIQVPAENMTTPVVGFIGVVPEQRGHGYGYDLLVECTRDLVDHGAERIAAATDVGNVPMAKGFALAGYPVTQHRFRMTRPGGAA